MDVYPTIIKEDQPLIVAEEIVGDEDAPTELGDKVADWMAKAYGSTHRKRSYYDPLEKAFCFNKSFVK